MQIVAPATSAQRRGFAVMSGDQALPQDGMIFCTRGISLGEEFLIERIGACSPEKLHEPNVAMELAGA